MVGEHIHSGMSGLAPSTAPQCSYLEISALLELCLINQISGPELTVVWGKVVLLLFVVLH